MKQKIIIGAAVLVLLIAILLMIMDMFQKSDTQSNPFEYELDNFSKIDSADFCYDETLRFIVDIPNLKAIASDLEDKIYLSASNTILIYDKDLNVLNEFTINEPARAITVASNGHLFLGITDHIEVWNTEGNQLESWPNYNERSVITSIALNDNTIYVADAGNKLILAYDLLGNLKNKIGGKVSGSDRPGFIIPSPYFDIDIGRDGLLWAVNSGMHTFEAYDNAGHLISSWKKTSMQLDGFSGCCNPSHFKILTNGSFVTSEKGLVRIKIHEPNGNFKCAVAGPDHFEKDVTGLDIAVSSEDAIYVIVPKNNEIRKYMLKSF